MKKVAWFSAGATSAVACKLALQKYDGVEINYIETGQHHPDNIRFIRECEEWFGCKINILQSRFKNVFDVIRWRKFINGPKGAACTHFLKVCPRLQWEYENEVSHYIWGFESGAKEEARAYRLEQRYPQYKHIFPLIEGNLEKSDCLALIKRAGIEIPMMYKLGYHNNNCIGCVKGGMGYWNKIRKDFPEIFDEMARLEREIGAHCLKDCYLDELPEEAGRNMTEIAPACSIYCAFVDF